MKSLLWYVIFFSLASFTKGFMDWIHFRRPLDHGYWSIHTKDTRDAWHDAAKMMWLFVAVGMIGISWYLLLFALINLFFHELSYHGIFKNINRKEK